MCVCVCILHGACIGASRVSPQNGGAMYIADSSSVILSGGSIVNSTAQWVRHSLALEGSCVRVVVPAFWAAGCGRRCERGV
jgi:hypothetical protein